MKKIVPLMPSRMKKNDVINLQEALLEGISQGVISIESPRVREKLIRALNQEYSSQRFGGVTERTVKLFQESQGIRASGTVDEVTAERLNTLLGEWGKIPFDPAAEPTEGKEKNYEMKGRIIYEDGRPAKGLKLGLYKQDFGGKATLLKKAETGDAGQYVFLYPPGERGLSLEVRALLDKTRGMKEDILLSNPINNLRNRPSLMVNLVAPAVLEPLACEYDRLTASLKTHIGAMENLAESRENKERQDLAVLNRTTGWDARVLGLAAITERLSADREVTLPKDALYGLLRAGLPSDKHLLAQVRPDAAVLALKKAVTSNIVKLGRQQMKEFKEQFKEFSHAMRLKTQTPGSRSTYGEMLECSGLGAKAQALFASVYMDHRGPHDQLWKKAQKKGLKKEEIRILKRQGQFAYLTSNSKEMTSKLMDLVKEPSELADRDFHRADAWIEEILSSAGIPPNRLDSLKKAEKETLERTIPVVFGGTTTEERLNAFAEDMARKIRISYPTQVVGRLIETDQSDAFRLEQTKEQTLHLLKKAASRGFHLGQTPVKGFFTKHADLKGRMSQNDFTQSQNKLETLHRVYQITPNNDAMPVLMNMGITSAYDVVAYGEDEFESLYESAYGKLYGRAPGKKESDLITRKSHQVTNVTYNLFAIVKNLENSPPLPVTSPALQERASAKNALIKHYPTMESLFGSIDYCECDHCRSVLSPAAYLVDILQFIDPEPEVWGNFLAHWENTHNGDAYSSTYKKPYDALVERRPDLPHIPLTCENTHTALPYIDVVNEILEYYVAHGALQADAAHDTGDATSAELLAEPQNVVRQAYDDLCDSLYPLNLPFDLWIETVRRFCSSFDVPLPRLLEILCPTEELFNSQVSFDRFAVFMESLGLAPAESILYTQSSPLTSWYELYGYESAAQATTEAVDPTTGQRLDLHSAKNLSRRVGVTYNEMAKILQTGFVNPEIPKLSVLYKLGVSSKDASVYLSNHRLRDQDPAGLSMDQRQLQWEVTAFSEKIDKAAEEFHIPREEIETEIHAIPFDKVLLLRDQNSGCDFDSTLVEYADGSPADAMAFLRINLFVRIWRTLGWTIEETDVALCTFIPTGTPFEEDHLASKPLQSALIHLSHFKALEEKLPMKPGRIPLLALWSDIFTTGETSLYRELFLVPSILETSPVFDHPLGLYLSDLSIALKDHTLALQSALGLRSNEISLILSEAGLSADTAKLSLPNVSLLFRYALFARSLDLSVKEMIALKKLSGLNPFHPLHPEGLAEMDEDYLFTQTLRFVEIAEKISESGLQIEDLEYLLRHDFDEAGKYRPHRETMLALLHSLSKGVRAIRSDHAVPENPADINDEELRQELGLVLQPDVLQRFFSMMNGTSEFTATAKGVAPENQLHPEDFSDEPSILEVRYNATRQEQTLTFRGVLFDEHKNALTARFPQALLAPLLTDIQNQAHDFFVQHLQKQSSDRQPASGFLAPEDFELLFAPAPPDLTDSELQDLLKEQRSRLLQTFLPFLRHQLIREFIIQKMISHTDADPEIIRSLLTKEQILSSRGPLLDALASTSDRGLSAAFFASEDTTGDPLGRTLLDDGDTGTEDEEGNPLKPAGTNSALLKGFLEVPASGAYRFYVSFDKKDSEALLQFSHLQEPTLTGTAGSDGDEIGDLPGQYIELKAGVLYPFSLSLRNLNSGNARLLVQGETLPKDSLNRLVLYSGASMAAAERAVVLLSKTLLLTQSLELGEKEMHYLSMKAEDFGGMNLSALPTNFSESTTADAAALFHSFTRLAEYARLKRELGVETSDLITLFEANDREDLPLVYALFATLTRREEALVKTCAEQLFPVPDFSNEKPMLRLWELLQAVQQCGVSPLVLADWTGIVSTSLHQEQRYRIACGAREALKARFTADTWQRVAQPIFDGLRQCQRDALVSYVMHQQGFLRMEQLYEYFLIDPGMEPVVKTSRIRLAISSVQLFIQRCLLNLEPQVHPSVIKAKQWEWMKRYRLWEANRKIFLFPENWLDPEFRDDKTHLFNELESALLEGDVSRDSAEDAFLSYLRKLDELARLNIVAMHIEDHPDPANRVLHVFGRTYAEPYHYFYRRYTNGMWTPWEPMNGEIEGDHLAPVVWRERLYLFWVTFLDKPDEEGLPGTTSGTTAADASLASVMADVKVSGINKNMDVQLHWSEYMKGKWSTRESGAFVPLGKKVPRDFDIRSVYIHVSKEYDEGEERGVVIHLRSSGKFKFSFLLAGRNSAPEQTGYSQAPYNPYNANDPYATVRKGKDELNVSYKRYMETDESGQLDKESLDVVTPKILHPALQPFTLLSCNNDIRLGAPEASSLDASNPSAVSGAVKKGMYEISSLVKPVFFQDSDNTFFVEPDVQEKTTEEWEEWVVQIPETDSGWIDDDWWEEVPVKPDIPWEKIPIPEVFPEGPFPDPIGPWAQFSINPASRFDVDPMPDWLVNQGTGLLFDDVLIGAVGQEGVTIVDQSSDTLAEEMATGMVVQVNAGSSLSSGHTVLQDDAVSLEAAGLSQASGGLNVIGKSGLNSAVKQNVSEIAQMNLQKGQQ